MKLSKEKLRNSCFPTIEPSSFPIQEDANPENLVVQVPEREDKSRTDDFSIKTIYRTIAYIQRIKNIKFFGPDIKNILSINFLRSIYQMLKQIPFWRLVFLFKIILHCLLKYFFMLRILWHSMCHFPCF
jgi:hypothetical protein